jgi:excisionase family DNA binding protein
VCALALTCIRPSRRKEIQLRHNTNSVVGIGKALFSIDQFLERYGIGRTTFYAELRAGRLRVVKCGRRTLVPCDAAEQWLMALPKRGGCMSTIADPPNAVESADAPLPPKRGRGRPRKIIAPRRQSSGS